MASDFVARDMFVNIQFTEFTEATNEYTDGISRHRLSLYTARYH